MQEIKLTQGKIAIVDDEDYERVNQHRWHAIRTKWGVWYAGRSVWDKQAGRSKGLRLHTFIINPSAGLMIDHINHDGLDNRRCNLRVCNNTQNSCNTRKQKGKTSKYKGVCRRKTLTTQKPWRALIGYNKGQIEVGTYETEIEAALAYNEAASKYFGEFAFLNKIEGYGKDA